MFGYIFSKRKREQRKAASKVFETVNAFSRSPEFYRDLSVPDTMTGRFDLLCLISSMVVLKLNKHADKRSQEFVQGFFDVMFRSCDRSLREGGIGDLSVPKHMKRMMQGFNGRIDAYKKLLIDRDLNDDDALACIQRNVYSDNAELDEYVLQKFLSISYYLCDHMLGADLDALYAGELPLPSYESLDSLFIKSIKSKEKIAV